jgi:hypothetical protein
MFPIPNARAGFFYSGTSPGNVPWPGGIVPYQFNPALSAAQTDTYLVGIREWELAANVTFIPRTNQTQYVLFKHDPFGPNRVSGANPQIVEVNSLSRAQVAHEVGHSLGFTHENIRPDQINYVLVLTNHVIPGEISWFVIDPAGVTNGAYDFESVMHLGRNFASINPNLDTQQARPGYERFQPRMGNYALSIGDRTAAAFLYGLPAVPLTNIVTTTRDGGPGSLRAALYYALDHPGTTITFNIPPSDPGYSNGVFNLKLSGHLPPLVTDGTVIDGATQPGFTGNPLIFVDGSEMLPETVVGSVSGLLIYAADCAVKNLSFTRFNWNGLTLLYADATNNTIAGCWCGPDASGTNRAPNDNQLIINQRQQFIRSLLFAQRNRLQDQGKVAHVTGTELHASGSRTTRFLVNLLSLPLSQAPSGAKALLKAQLGCGVARFTSVNCSGSAGS